MTFGLSKTTGLGPSETRSSAYRKPGACGNPQKSAPNRHPSNNANRIESFGFLLTALRPVDNRAAPALPTAHIRLANDMMAGGQP